jgi:hypothetical protein
MPQATSIPNSLLPVLGLKPAIASQAKTRANRYLRLSRMSPRSAGVLFSRNSLASTSAFAPIVAALC